MAIGNDPSLAQLNSLAANLATQWRNLAVQTMELQNYAVAAGQAGLVAKGFASGDATTFLTQCNYMATLAQVVQGTATQSSLFNFVTALIPLTGPS
jgi:hypothetical protein